MGSLSVTTRYKQIRVLFFFLGACTGLHFDQPKHPQPRTRLQILEELWDGLDVEGVELDEIHPSPRIGMKDDTGTKLQILGMFDSGTNLLGSLLKANFGAGLMEEMCPGSTSEGYHCHFWKHTPPQDIHPQDCPGCKTVALVRSPLGQLSSWIKAPYDLDTCMKHVDWSHDKESACSFAHGSRLYSFNGPTGVWNDYTVGYQRLSADGPIKIVEYEDLVMNTEQVIRNVSDFLGLSMASFAQVTQPAKGHGQPHGRQEAIERVSDMTYLRNPPWSQISNIESVCRNLDDEMLETHSYVVDSNVTDQQFRYYKADCAKAFGETRSRSVKANMQSHRWIRARNDHLRGLHHEDGVNNYTSHHEPPARPS